MDKIEAIHNYCDDIVCIYSDNDPYLPFDVLTDFANKVSDRKIVLPNAGHINKESGFDSFKQILDYIN